MSDLDANVRPNARAARASWACLRACRSLRSHTGPRRSISTHARAHTGPRLVSYARSHLHRLPLTPLPHACTWAQHQQACGYARWVPL